MSCNWSIFKHLRHINASLTTKSSQLHCKENYVLSKKLPKHVNTQSQMFNRLIMDSGLDEVQVTKYSFVLHWTHHLNHGNFCQFHVFWNVVKQDGRINVNPSHFNQRPINSMMGVQGNFGITFHGGLEHGFLHI
jgi:hypothetical protein